MCQEIREGVGYDSCQLYMNLVRGNNYATFIRHHKLITCKNRDRKLFGIQCIHICVHTSCHSLLCCLAEKSLLGGGGGGGDCTQIPLWPHSVLLNTVQLSTPLQIQPGNSPLYCIHSHLCAIILSLMWDSLRLAPTT